MNLHNMTLFARFYHCQLRYVIVLFLIAFMVLLTACQDDSTNARSVNDSHIISAEFSPETYHKKHKISAFVQSIEQAQLAFQISGRLAEQWVEIGQQVNQGEPLLRLYNPDLEPQINAIEAQLQANSVDLKQTESELKRNQSLSDIQAISQNQLERLQSQADQLKAQQVRLVAQLQAAKNRFKEATLSAPFNGEVADILIKPGTQVQAGQPVMELSGSQLLEAPLYIGNNLLSHLTVNQTLNASHSTQKLTVTIKEISRSANPSSQLFKVLVHLPANSQLLAGQKIEVVLPEPLDNIYQLPVSAVIDDGINEPYVFVRDNGEIKHYSVQVVQFYDNHIWVNIPNQNEKLNIITAGQSTVTPPQFKTAP